VVEPADFTRALDADSVARTAYSHANPSGSVKGPASVTLGEAR